MIARTAVALTATIVLVLTGSGIALGVLSGLGIAAVVAVGRLMRDVERTIDNGHRWGQ